MSIITLTTDYGNKDYSVSELKAKIYNEISDVRIVDVSHNISPFNLTEAAYIIKSAYRHFPKDSIHIIGIESELTPENAHLAMKFNNNYFIGADNGIFSMIIDDFKADSIVEINIHKNYNNTISANDVFVKVATHISRDGKLEVIGKKINSIKEIKDIKPVISIDNNQIIGSVIYIDNYGNVVTNITEKIFTEISKSRPFTIYARNVKFDKIFNSYSDAIDYSVPKEKREEDGKKIALFNNLGYLELSIYKSNPSTVGSASTLFGLGYRDQISIHF
ncbi:MAG: SAM-dependent chlorinase/fluorinase [Bacteroidota bacterium]|nr:SAM-dependent chlorinase/fluorinase [Bacteroidota bacterium]|tara:strand:+ start:4388 stop:5215 length:828 start_codon:yes stop_codon:yes gene_type:complete